MMRRFLRRGLAVLGLLSLAVAAPAAAQDDTASMVDRSRLLQRIQDRFGAQVKEQLGLTDQQAARMKETTANWFLKRRDLEGQEQRARQAMASQLRPGVAANKDSVTKLIDKLLALRVSYAESFRQEDRELAAYLDPVQRAQYLVLRERLLERVQKARDERLQNGGRAREQP
ncbi:MAG TPA: Spy/CpxP family protein refolding chaperone [Gemmatimonadales bacterium]|nr:Spy/CpxP family protein refolding chaperone [Gemmatimonadales bacterium]